jgi:mRNA-degrading endonuclease RelE of RelBE toxin-antitoxin system
MTWTIEIDRTAKRDLDGLDQQIRRRVFRFLNERLPTWKIHAA